MVEEIVLALTAVGNAAENVTKSAKELLASMQGIIQALGPCDDILPLTPEEIESFKQDKANEEQNLNNPISDIRE